MISAFRRRLARPFRARARAAQARGDWRAALSAYQQVVRLTGLRPPLLLQIGHMQGEIGQYDEAYQSFEGAASDPEVRLRALVGSAGVAERRGEWAVAIGFWEQVLERMAEEEGTSHAASWPLTPAVAVMHVAKCREAMGDGAGAEGDFAFALVLDPAVRFSREAVLMRARMLLKTSRTTAFRFLERSHRAYADDRGIALLLLRTALDLGQREEARRIVGGLSGDVRNDAGLKVWLEENNLLISETSP